MDKEAPEKHRAGLCSTQTHLFVVVLKQSLYMVPGNNIRTNRMIPKSTDLLTCKLFLQIKKYVEEDF